MCIQTLYHPNAIRQARDHFNISCQTKHGLNERIKQLALAILLCLPLVNRYFVNQPPAPKFIDPIKHNSETKKKIDQYFLENKKVCLFIGRMAHQSLPINEDEVWVSLDNAPVTELAKDRLHLIRDFNKTLVPFNGKFSRVVVDFSVVKFMDHKDPYRRLQFLLKKSEESELFIESSPGVFFPQLMSPKEETTSFDRVVPIEIFYNKKTKEKKLNHLIAQREQYTIKDMKKYFQEVSLNEGVYPFGELTKELKYYHCRNTIGK